MKRKVESSSENIEAATDKLHFPRANSGADSLPTLSLFPLEPDLQALKEQWRRQQDSSASALQPLDQYGCSLPLSINSGGDPKFNGLSLFPLAPDLQDLKKSWRRQQDSGSSVVTDADHDACTLSLSINQTGGFGPEETIARKPFKRPRQLVSSKALSYACINSVQRHFSSIPSVDLQVSSLEANGQQSLDAPVNVRVNSPKEKGPLLEAPRKSFPSLSRADFLLKPASTSNPGISNKSASLVPASKKIEVPPSTGVCQVGLTHEGQLVAQAPGPILRQKGGPSNGSRKPSNQNRSLPDPLPEETQGPPNQQRRPSDPSERPSNQDGPISGVSAFKGVTHFKRTDRWEAHIWNSAEKKQQYLGSFSTELKAARAYDRATLYFRGVGAQLHFQLEDYAGELRQLMALTKDELLNMLKEQSHGVGSLYPSYPRSGPR